MNTTKVNGAKVAGDQKTICGERATPTIAFSLGRIRGLSGRSQHGATRRFCYADLCATQRDRAPHPSQKGACNL